MFDYCFDNFVVEYWGRYSSVVFEVVHNTFFDSLGILVLMSLDDSNNVTFMKMAA